ncbi:MAG: hypothetical protein IFK94_00015 [Acidobacteria bacterium]|uniref:Biotin carboxyl carrier protein of acetyl-CoA carboxylase n=1 Tax=Candidatus Polarisedimenticola svalbardensis TaxID=2886004 RepID=A0A8J6XPU6_9BACT|nr:hypothetical protein [Candidatus Polarisedimenticola svalbardensis]
METLTALTRTTDDGKTEILSPKVGIWSAHPKDRSLLSSQATIGKIRCQTRTFTLQIPDGVSGRISADTDRDRSAAVEYGELLFTLEPIGTDLSDPKKSQQPKSKPGDQLPPGCHAITSPTDGVFYARPAPDAEPFVKKGETIHLGHTIGLVEVMKTFNPILYGGPDLPDKAEVVELRAEDGREIRAGDVLLVVN